MNLESFNCSAITKPYIRTARAVVAEVRRHFVRLDETIFFPEMSAQPFDQGRIRLADGSQCDVVAVCLRKGLIWHQVEGPVPSVGESVTCQLDWPRRFFLMRSHTAAVLVSGLAHRVWQCSVTSCSISEDRVRLDLSCSRRSEDEVRTLIEKASSICKKGHKTCWYKTPIRTLDSKPKLVRSATTMSSVNGKIVRVVRIGSKLNPIEEQCDVGTHVRSLAEIGDIHPGARPPSTRRICENKGKNHFRIRFHLKELANGGG